MRQRNGTVVNNFDEFHSLDQILDRNWERFQSDGIIPKKQRSFILSSWDRCKQSRIDPLKQEADIVYQDESLKDQKEQNQILLDVAEPYMEELFHYFSDQVIIVVLANKDGIIIEGKANNYAWNRAERYRFLPGADWREFSAGTNAIGTALVEERPIQIFSSEHFCRGWHSWVCSAAPIKDPITKQVIGVLDMTGEKELVHAHNIHLMINQAQKIEQALELRLIKDQLLPLNLFFDSSKNPYLFFDVKGKTTSCNKAAKYLLNLSEGTSIFDTLGFPQQVDFQLLKVFGQTYHYQKDGNMWDVKVQPYKLGDHLLGGIAVFQRHVLPHFNSKKNAAKYEFNDIITRDSAMLKLLESAKKSAFSNNNVMVFGETGTGKEVLVQSIHNFGPRNRYPFVAVNCGAIPKDLVASELFGYEGGAFTGAKSKGKKGKFLLANQGTIFLDEIADLPLDIQVYLLRVLEEREVLPIGANEPIPIDVRVICATHKDLKEEVKKGNFREDLYYRLNVISLSLPPLRERKDDIPLLVDSFLTENGKKLFEMSNQVMDLLIKYDWPGNIRQLKNCIEQSKFNANGKQILPEHLSKEILPSYKKIVKEQPGLPQQRVKIDKNGLVQALENTNGNVTQAAKLLNVSRMTIYRKKEEFNLE